MEHFKNAFSIEQQAIITRANEVIRDEKKFLNYYIRPHAVEVNIAQNFWHSARKNMMIDSADKKSIWQINGRPVYQLPLVPETWFLLQMILEQPEKKSWIILDLGAGAFQLVDTVVQFLIHKTLENILPKDNSYTIIGTTGEQYFEGPNHTAEGPNDRLSVHRCNLLMGNRNATTIENCKIYKFDLFLVENLKQNLLKRDLMLDGKCDLIIANLLLEHLADPSGLINQMQELATVGGFIFFNVAFHYTAVKYVNKMITTKASASNDIEYKLVESLTKFGGPIYELKYELEVYDVAQTTSIIITTLFETGEFLLRRSMEGPVVLYRKLCDTKLIFPFNYCDTDRDKFNRDNYLDQLKTLREKLIKTDIPINNIFSDIVEIIFDKDSAFNFHTQKQLTGCSTTWLQLAGAKSIFQDILKAAYQQFKYELEGVNKGIFNVNSISKEYKETPETYELYSKIKGPDICTFGQKHGTTEKFIDTQDELREVLTKKLENIEICLRENRDQISDILRGENIKIWHRGTTYEFHPYIKPIVSDLDHIEYDTTAVSGNLNHDNSTNYEG